MSVKLKIMSFNMRCDYANDGNNNFENRKQRIVSFLEKEVIARVIESSYAESEPPTKITLYQALPKGDKMETIIQKTVEIIRKEHIFGGIARPSLVFDHLIR